MRDIKFRAWDAQHNCMTYKVLVGNTCDKDDRYTAHSLIRDVTKKDYSDDSVWMHFDEYSEVVLMQYTGVKDKNGVEIYEGCIVEITSKVAHTTTRGGVYYDDRVCAFMVDDTIFKQYLPITIEDTIEVVGNIYENPELLK